MMCSFRTLTRALIACVCIVSFTAGLRAQTNTTPWPNNPPVGIGTQPDGVPQNALQIHYDPARSLTMPAMLRLSDGDSTNSNIFGLLGLMPPAGTTAYSSLSRGDDLILHEHSRGDLILTNLNTGEWSMLPGAIRLATTPVDTTLPAPGPLVPPANTDLERVTILSNGNVGIDLPPDSATGLGTPMDQIQIGGGSIPPPAPWYTGYTTPLPGLTISGGNRFEGMMRPDTAAPYPVDYRGIAFNHYENHMTGVATRFAPMSGSGIGFADVAGGLVTMGTWPFDSSRGMHDFSGGTTLSLTGTNGLEFWSDESRTGGRTYHHLFDCWRPGFLGYGVTRNQYGLFYHRTPVYIGIDSVVNTDFTNLLHVNPDIGDGQTWMLAVNGAALFKEAFVSLDWPDFVFQPDYKLPSLRYVEKYIEIYHHLPGVPSASDMAKTGVPLGATEAKMMQKIEELTKYAIEQDKKIEKLEAEMQKLKNQKGR